MVKKIVVLSFVLIAITAAVSGCYQNTQAAAQDGAGIQVRGGGSGTSRGSRVGQTNGASNTYTSRSETDWRTPGSGSSLPAAGELSESEAEGLLFMREEEKLAHDVYTELYAAWWLPVFQNIADSEQTHMEAIKSLLDRYDLEDPAQDQAGIYTNPALQDLYNELIVSGSNSLAEALKVGAAIEEIDIQDLESRLALTDNLDIQQVYSNLLRGSKNHLRAYTKTLLTQTGETYEPQHLSIDAYLAITSQASSNSGHGQGGRIDGGGRGRQGGWS